MFPRGEEEGLAPEGIGRNHHAPRAPVDHHDRELAAQPGGERLAPSGVRIENAVAVGWVGMAGGSDACVDGLAVVDLPVEECERPVVRREEGLRRGSARERAKDVDGSKGAEGGERGEVWAARRKALISERRDAISRVEARKEQPNRKEGGRASMHAMEPTADGFV